MLLPPRLTTHPALLPAAMPLVAGVGSGYALLSFMGGGTRVWHMTDGGGYGVLLMGAVLGVMVLLSRLLRTPPSTQPAPLVVLVGLATLPWFLGIAGTQEAMERVLETLPADVRSGSALAVLVSGTGEAMVMRLVGAWMSAALLGAVAVGLVLQHWRTPRGVKEAGRLLGAALGLALGSIALMVAVEAHELFELLTTLATQGPEARAGLIATVTARLTGLHELRSATLGALAVLALALVCWQFFLRPEAVQQWAGSLVLVAIAATVLVLDGRPLKLAVGGSRQTDASRTLTPLRVRDLLTSALDATPRPPFEAPNVRSH